MKIAIKKPIERFKDSIKLSVLVAKRSLHVVFLAEK